MSEKLDITYRFYKPGDEGQIVDLLCKVFPHGWGKFTDPNNYWHWKFIEGPLKRQIIVAAAGDKILGCEQEIVFKAKLGSEVTTMVWGDDLAVHPDYRGMKISSKMLDFRISNNQVPAKYHYETTVNPIVKRYWKKMDAQVFPFTINRLVKVKDPSLFFKMRSLKNQTIMKAGYSGLKMVNQAKNKLTIKDKRIDDYRIMEIPNFNEDINTFWEKIRDDYRFILERTQEFLNWRFRRPDGDTYKIFQAIKDREIIGYAVVKTSLEDGYTEGQIEDLLALKNREDVADGLLDHIISYMEKKGANAIYYQVVSGHPYDRLASQKGLLVSFSKPQILFRQSTGDILGKNLEIAWLKETQPSQVSFGYAETV